MRRNKTFLFVPGDSGRKIESARGINGGAVILDLEDGVAEGQKKLALQNVQTVASTITNTELWVRLNQIPRAEEEFEQLKGQENIKGFWIPKAEPASCKNLISTISKQGKKVGVLIETAKGYVQRNELLGIEGVTHVQLGQYDLAGDLGIQLESPVTKTALSALRLEIAIAARANQLEGVVGPVSANFKDLEKFNSSCEELVQLGYDARACIHPDQIPVVHKAFTPSPEQVDWASAILNRFKKQTSLGSGAYVEEDGSMADAATVRTARSILGRAED